MIDIRVNLRGVFDGFDRLKKTDGRKIFRAARKPLRADLRDHAVKQADVGGRWAPRAASTTERRSRGRKRKFRGRLLGRLPGAFTVRVGANYIRATSRVPWSQAQNRGGRVGHGSRLPRRRFAWLSRAVRVKVRDLYLAELKRSWASG